MSTPWIGTKSFPVSAPFPRNETILSNTTAILAVAQQKEQGTRLCSIPPFVAILLHFVCLLGCGTSLGTVEQEQEAEIGKVRHMQFDER